MMPEYLKGKSETDIYIMMKAKFYIKHKALLHEEIIGKDSAINFNDAYMRYLEKFLLLAVQDALCNTIEVVYIDGEDTYWSYADRANQAEQRAIEFLNMLLPEEK